MEIELLQKPCIDCGQDFGFWHYKQVRCDQCLARTAREKRLLTKYGLAAGEFERMAQSQNGCCVVCGSIPKSLSVDHDHKTGRVRGLLCSPCNIQLGVLERLDDAPEWVASARAYLGQQTRVSPAAARERTDA